MTAPGRAVHVLRTFTAAMLAAVVAALPALAHNGVGAFFKGRSGGYIVYAYDGELVAGGSVDYKLVLLDRRTRDPVYDVSSAVSADPPGGAAVRRAEVTTFGNVVYYRLPNPYPDRWQARLVLDGARGHTTVRFALHGVAPAPSSASTGEDSGNAFPWWALSVGIVLLLVGGWVLASRRRLRQSSGAPGGVDGQTTGKQDTA